MYGYDQQGSAIPFPYGSTYSAPAQTYDARQADSMQSTATAQADNAWSAYYGSASQSAYSSQAQTPALNSWTQWGAAAYGSDGYGTYGQSSSAYGATPTDYSKDDSAAAGFGPATGSSYPVGGSYGTSSTAASYGNGSSSSTAKFTPMSATTNVYSSTINSLKAKSNPAEDTSGHYAGYEDAVYAAASNYIQGKRAGVYGKPNGSAGGAAAQQRYCEICNVTCAGDIPMKAHLEGKQHKEKARFAASGGPDLRTRQVSMRCEACNVTCTGRDAYTAHTQGAKHQKTVALFRQMGKPVPTDPTLMPPTTGNFAPTTGPKKVVGITGTNFVRAGETRLSTASGTIGPQQPPQQPLNNVNVPPIGEEFVEVRNTGAKVTQYHCKLCDCPLGDSVAKMAHLTGRRHRLQYKQKVDPLLQVEPRPHEQRYPKPGQVRPGGPVPLAAVGSAPQFFHPTTVPQMRAPPAPAPSTLIHPVTASATDMNEDDRLVQFRHVKVKPTAQQLQQIERLVTHIEKTLKQVSDHLHENGMKPPESSGDQRILKGIMRVGHLAKNILLGTDTQIELVVLCSQVPTYALLHKITEHFLEFGQASNDGPVGVSEQAEQSAIHVTMGDYQCCVYLTSVLVRAITTGESKSETTEDALPVEPCLKALAELRHAKWYQVKCLPLQHCGMMLRIIRDVRSRVTTWEAMTSWTLELLVERTLASIGHPVGPAAALRYIFEMLSSGVIINSNPWLFDPCEKEQVDVLADLTGQQREDITSSAQHALRLIAFDQIHVILGMDDRSTDENASTDRKRSLETNGTVAGGESADAKKVKEG